MGNSAKMDKRNSRMTYSQNVFCRFFYILVMLHKILYSHFTDWNNKRKRKAFGAGIYALTILPELLLLNGTLFAAAGQDGYVHLESDWQKVVFYGVSGLALLLMVIPLGFLDDKKIRKEVRQELCERPRYWKRAMVIYIATIMAMVVAVNAAFPHLKPETAPRKEEVAASLSRSNDFPDEIKGVLQYCVKDSIQADSLDMERARGIHAHCILPLLAELAHALNGSGEAERMADGAGYCDVRYYLDVCGTATDFPKAGDTWITVDILSFDDGNPDIKRSLNALRGKEYLAVEMTQEAPEQCLVFTEGGKLIADCCVV